MRVVLFCEMFSFFIETPENNSQQKSSALTNYYIIWWEFRELVLQRVGPYEVRNINNGIIEKNL